jgi:predicted signal transduction protein with EAL and GGDEF domain
MARLSGDEFAVLIDAYTSLSSLARVSSRLLTKLRVPMSVAGHELVVSASLGISLLPENAREISALISQANMAMQHAKHLGGEQLPVLHRQPAGQHPGAPAMENQLRKAIDEGQLDVYYQPKLNLASGRLDSAEALVRWRHPQLGMVPPAIHPAGRGNRADRRHRRVRPASRLPPVARMAARGLTDLRLSVNLSVHQLRQGNLASLVRTVLDETALAPHLLELELTESQLLDNVESVGLTFRQLRQMGVKLAIDDFGTGYSSLSYLKRFPVDYVKIDQTFIRDLSTHGEDAAITRAIIAMATAWN